MLFSIKALICLVPLVVVMSQSGYYHLPNRPLFVPPGPWLYPPPHYHYYPVKPDVLPEEFDFSYENRRMNRFRFPFPFYNLDVTNQLSDDVVINVPGYAQQLKGTTGQSSFSGRTYYAFRSVYYAEMPTNVTRFLPPVPKSSYPPDQVVDATTDNAGCPQPTGTENCLSLNIYTPRLPPYGLNARRLPVMFWIHGGTNSVGKASDYNPDKFMEADIVLVVIQYRLGPLGWLSLGTDDAPGNAALFDMIEALRWVNKHISAFGGNPNEVTIAGQSSGAANVMILMLAPQAKGLFHRAIAQSGVILPSYSYVTSAQGTTASTAIAGIAGCTTTSYSAMLDCVRNADPVKLSTSFFLYSAFRRKNFDLGLAGSYPVIQTAGAQRILQKDPAISFSTGDYNKVPFMLGTTKQDGSFILGVLYLQTLLANNLQNNSTFLANQLVPALVKAFGVKDDDGSKAAAYTSKYLSGAQLGNFTSMTPGLTDICSVLWLKLPTYDTARLLGQHNRNIYLYSFEFPGANSYFDKVFFPPPITPPIPPGVCHDDDMIYLFTNKPFPSLNSTEVAFSKQMIRIWTQFVKYGNPTPLFSGHRLDGIPTFPRYSQPYEKYMVIDKTWSIKNDYTNTYVTTAG